MELAFHYRVGCEDTVILGGTLGKEKRHHGRCSILESLCCMSVYAGLFLLNPLVWWLQNGAVRKLLGVAGIVLRL